jgi:hypothetical protein
VASVPAQQKKLVWFDVYISLTLESMTILSIGQLVLQLSLSPPRAAY